MTTGIDTTIPSFVVTERTLAAAPPSARTTYDQVKRTATRYARMIEHQQIGKLLRAARLRAGLTQADLAEKLAYTPQQVSRWEHGTRGIPERLWPDLLAVLDDARAHKRRTEQVLREIAERGSEEW